MHYCLYSRLHPRVLKEITFSNVKYVDRKVSMVTVRLFPLVLRLCLQISGSKGLAKLFLKRNTVQDFFPPILLKCRR